MAKRRTQLLSLIIIITSHHIVVSGQETQLKKWSGTIINAVSHSVIPHATIASYSQVALYIANDAGQFLLTLPHNDSLRITALGYESQTTSLQEAEMDSVGRVIIRLTPISYQIKEVTIKGYKGIFDPLIFQNHLPDEELIQLNLPAHIGSQISKLPPNERTIGDKPSIGMIFSPASLVYSLFSKRENSIRTLADARANELKLNHRDMVASKEIIAAISDFKDKELDDFLIFCNINLKIYSSDTGVSALRKIEEILLTYKQEKRRELKDCSF